jgi:hypothetical protein
MDSAAQAIQGVRLAGQRRENRLGGRGPAAGQGVGDQAGLVARGPPGEVARGRKGDDQFLIAARGWGFRRRGRSVGSRGLQLFRQGLTKGLLHPFGELLFQPFQR